jgi:hypothetical protein
MLRSLLLVACTLNFLTLAQNQAPTGTTDTSTSSQPPAGTPPAAQATTTTLSQNLKSTKASVQAQQQALSEVAKRYIFAAWPEFPNPSFNTQNPPLYPLKSINEAAVEKLYGPSGLAVDTVLLNYIKAFYFYLEYCTKRERAAQILTLANQYTLDFDTILKSGRWSDLVTAVSQKGAINYSTIVPTQDAWQDVTQALSDTFTSEKKDLTQFWAQLTTTSFWTDLTVTNTDIKNSIFWQDYAKVMITKTVQLDSALIDSRLINEQQIFNYLPYLETAYYLPDYTEQRYTSELNELALVLNEHCRNRFLSQSNDWGSLKNSKTKEFEYAKIIDQVLCYQRSHFFQIVQNFSIPTCDAQGHSATGFLPCDPACDPYCDKTNPQTISCADIPFVQQADGSFTLQPVTVPQPYKYEIMFLSMAVTLQSLLYDLFQGQKLEKTLTVLAADKSMPELSILPYEIEDAVYLQDWAALSSVIPAAAEQNAANDTASKQFSSASKPPLPQKTLTPATPQTSQADNETVTPQSFGNFVDWVKGFGKSIGQDIVSAGKAIWATATDVVDIAVNEAEVLYYQTGLATLIQGIPSAQAQQLEAGYQAALNNDFTSFQTDVTSLVTNVVKIAEAPGEAVVGSVLAGIGAILNDPSLASDYDKMLETVADAVGTAVGGIAAIGARLNVDAIMLLTNTIVSITTGPDDWLNDWKDVAADLVSSILESVSIAVNAVKEVISDVIQSIGYLIKLITDSIIDVGAACEAVYDAAKHANLSQIGSYYQQAQTSLDTHRNFISELVTVTLLVAATAVVTVATGGSATALVVGIGANLVFGTFMCESGWQQDQAVESIEDDITQYLANFTIWANNQVVIVQAMQNSMVEEISEGLNAEITNAEIGLGFYENFLNTTVNQTKLQAGYQLGSFQAQLLAPDPAWKTSGFNLIPGDVGTVFGYSTGWLNLNPSQGFVAYEPSRKHFAQEIAQLPATFTTTDPTTNQKVQVPAFWFLQSISKDSSQSPTSQVVFEIRLRPIYLLNSFYVGIAIGGIPLDPDELSTTQQANIDRYNLAKMIVFKKETSSSPVTIGVYEHETPISTATDGWLSSTTAPAFNLGAWYHIRGTLNGNTLQVQVWPETTKTTPTPSSVTVTPLPTKVYAPDGVTQIPVNAVPLSVITSGASIEFDIVTPAQTKNLAPQCTSSGGSTSCSYPSRSNANYSSAPGPAQTEAGREATINTTYKKNIAPTFGSFTDLAAASPYEIIKGHYIYTTSKTNSETDYVVFAALDSAKSPVTVTGIGSAPSQLSNEQACLISLVTGKIFDSTGQVKGSQSGVWGAYQSQNEKVGSLISSSLSSEITTAQKAFVASIIKPYTFGGLTLTPASSDDFANGNYVYTTIIAGKTDYVILANLSAAPEPNTPFTGYVTTTNITPTQLETDNAAMISIVTMSVYSEKTCTSETACTPILCLPATMPAQKKSSGQLPGVASTYFKVPLSQTVLSGIQEAIKTAVSCAQQKQPPPTQQQTPTSGPQQTDPGSIAPNTGEQPPSTTVPTTTVPETSTAVQQQEAASGGGW